MGDSESVYMARCSCAPSIPKPAALIVFVHAANKSIVGQQIDFPTFDHKFCFTVKRFLRLASFLSSFFLSVFFYLTLILYSYIYILSIRILFKKNKAAGKIRLKQSKINPAAHVIYHLSSIVHNVFQAVSRAAQDVFERKPYPLPPSPSKALRMAPISAM